MIKFHGQQSDLRICQLSAQQLGDSKARIFLRFATNRNRQAGKPFSKLSSIWQPLLAGRLTQQQEASGRAPRMAPLEVCQHAFHNGIIISAMQVVRREMSQRAFHSGNSNNLLAATPKGSAPSQVFGRLPTTACAPNRNASVSTRPIDPPFGGFPKPANPYRLAALCSLFLVFMADYADLVTRQNYRPRDPIWSER